MKKYKPGQIVRYQGKMHLVADKIYYMKVYPNFKKTSPFFDRMNPSDFADFLLLNDSKEICDKCQTKHGSYTLVELGLNKEYLGQKSQVCELQINKSSQK